MSTQGNNNRATTQELLNLPLELRRQIYSELLVQATPILLKHFPRSRGLRPSYSCYRIGSWANSAYGSILFVCKKIYVEAIEVFFAENLFVLHFDGGFCASPGFNGVPPGLRIHIRRLQTVLRPEKPWRTRSRRLLRQGWGAHMGPRGSGFSWDSADQCVQQGPV
jgi:hypothetical protein